MFSKKYQETFRYLSKMQASNVSAWDEMTSIVYFDLLSDLDETCVLEATKICCKQSRFRPSVSEIREVAYSLQHPEIKTAEEAWNAVSAWRKRYGEYGKNTGHFRSIGAPPEFDSAPEYVKSAIESLGGWISFARSDTEGSIERAQFMKIYNAFKPSAFKMNFELARMSIGSSKQLTSSNRTYIEGKI